MDDDIFPGDFDIQSLSHNDLLETFVLAGSWVNGSCSVKQERAWTKLEQECRAEILERMS